MVKFLNTYEIVTYDKIKAAADKYGANVFSKVRLRDVLPVDDSGISTYEYNYALKAHVDFLVTNSMQEPQFCVEFDGPSHRQPEQVKRDLIKNRLFERFDMPYLRIKSNYLEDRFRGLDLLTYFVEVWFIWIAFNEAQAGGHIADDEIFDPSFIYSDGSDSTRTWPYWLSWHRQIRLQRMYDKGTLAQMVPSHWIGEDKRGNLRCIAWLFVSEHECQMIETGMREHCFPAVCCSELLS